MVRVKICGITNIEDALFCSEYGADALGFIFWKKSARYVSPHLAKKIIRNLSPFISVAGVFVDEKKENVLEYASDLNLDILQFHGKESPSYCKFFSPRYKVIKTFFPKKSIPDIYPYDVKACLFDVKWEDKQKNKTTLENKVLTKIRDIKGKKIILSGGLTPDNVSALIKKVNPYAVDVASGVEVFPGKKDKKLIKLFIKRAKAAA